MLVRIMRAYDPPTNQFRIRGKTREIDGKDVAQLLGVPHKGDEVKMNVSDTDPFLQQLRKEYGKMKYDDVLNVITSGESGDKFEMLFMMHMLGTFLAPTSSTTPAEKLLKVLTSTINGFARFDWATYIAKDIQKELADYVNAIRGNNNCNSYVGGCIYMLLVLKDLHGNLMGITNDSHKRLVAAVEDELRKAQEHIERQRKQEGGEADDDADDVDDNGQHLDSDDEGEEGDGDHHDDGESGYDDDKAPGTPIGIDESDGGSPIGEGGTKGEQSIVPYQVHQQYAPRRSHRLKMEKNMSPWTLTKPVKRPRKAKEEKAIFFDLISGSCTNEESEQNLIQKDDEDLTREQLQTLGRRNKLSNRSLFVTKPSSWKVAEWEYLLLPQHIGYNIGDCDMIMGPILVKEHWFCVALDPSTMSFYVLDSMNNKVYTSKKKQTAFVNPQSTAIKKL
ncbi:hypothetical protein K1719_000580 [Acacia pycnantha]|nr:hypothetical protein K1719_000580 [Acacia pycnantha]